MEFTPKFNPKTFQVLLRDLARHEKFNTDNYGRKKKKS